MHLLAISEHFFPRVGGTVNYLHETLSALTRQGVQVELWVPGPMPDDWLPEGMAAPAYEVVWIDAGYRHQGEPTREARYGFGRKVNDMALIRARRPDAPDVLHVVFGLFVMEVLDTGALRAAGLPSLATVHNVPPQECRLVAPGAPLHARMQEEARLWLVGWKNRSRLLAHRWDGVVVPSDQVKSLLASVLPDQEIDVIGHGPTEDLLARMDPPHIRQPEPDVPLRLLTVGGYAPHKRQHLIPKVAARLVDMGIAFEWDVVGPEGRIAGYYDSVRKAAFWAGLQDRVRISGAVSFTELARLYDAANLYLQPSVEEGFCITALDAAASGLPVIASPAGALTRITVASGGMLVNSATEPLAQAIADFVVEHRWGDAAEQTRAVRSQFSWDAAAQALMARYATVTVQKMPKHA